MGHSCGISYGDEDHVAINYIGFAEAKFRLTWEINDLPCDLLGIYV